MLREVVFVDLETMSLTLASVLLLFVTPSWAYFADWTMMGGRPHEPTCVDIPKNMSLCSDIGYDKMRLPNLLDHDTLTEVQQQSGSWVPLLNVQCHPHTKLFLCSLFTPVCLQSQIFPCRSLCISVQKKCEARMITYGYNWPAMLSCDKFPEDNDMCIKPPDKMTEIVPEKSKNRDSKCGVCKPLDTFENILDNFCRAEIVLRARVKKQKGEKLTLKMSKLLKSDGLISKKKKRKLFMTNDKKCCHFQSGKQKYLIMGSHDVQKDFVSPTFVLPWKKSKSLRKAVRLFKNLNCTDPNLFTPSLHDGTILPKGDKKELNKLSKRERKKLRRGQKNRKRGRKNRRKGYKNGEEKKKKRRRGKKNKKNRRDRKKELADGTLKLD